ncbi:MAG: SIMPL domain-containing protein [Gammaproteobacteria bacterium]|nr:SIMPL domain-containing protein [Gammaproteobacteria bacterium]
MNDVQRPFVAGSGSVVGALVLALGIALAGYLVGDALRQSRSAERQVTVRGFAEREVPANLVLWPIVFSVTSNDLVTLQQRADDGVARVLGFLGDDFPREQVSVSAPRVQDREAQGMMSDGRRMDRYTAEVTVTVRTDRIDVARQSMQRSGELVKQGVAVIRSYEYNTQYLYTELEKVKPAMIAEATRDARRAAEQFAQDSGSSVGAIRRAQQGLFSVEDRDQFSPEIKRVRVVTTVDYYLE